MQGREKGKGQIIRVCLSSQVCLSRPSMQGWLGSLAFPKTDRPSVEGTEATSIKDQKQADRSTIDGIDQVAAGDTGAVTLVLQEQQRETAAGDGAVTLISQERRLSKSRKSVVSTVRNSFRCMSSKNVLGKKTSTTADSTAAETNQAVGVAMRMKWLSVVWVPPALVWWPK
jgi:hypothetical protein